MKRRTKVKGVRLTTGEVAALKRAALRDGMGVGEWMRERLLAGLGWRTSLTIARPHAVRVANRGAKRS